MGANFGTGSNVSKNSKAMAAFQILAKIQNFSNSPLAGISNALSSMTNKAAAVSNNAGGATAGGQALLNQINQGGGAAATPFQGSQLDFYNQTRTNLYNAAIAQGLPNPDQFARSGAAIAMQETGGGTRILGNNLFGMHQAGDLGTTVADGIKKDFGVYSSPEASANEFTSMMKNRYPEFANGATWDQQTRGGQGIYRNDGAMYNINPDYAKYVQIQDQKAIAAGANQPRGNNSISNTSTDDTNKPYVATDDKGFKSPAAAADIKAETDSAKTTAPSQPEVQMGQATDPYGKPIGPPLPQDTIDKGVASGLYYDPKSGEMVTLRQWQVNNDPIYQQRSIDITNFEVRYRLNFHNDFFC